MTTADHKSSKAPISAQADRPPPMTEACPRCGTAKPIGASCPRCGSR